MGDLVKTGLDAVSEILEQPQWGVLTFYTALSSSQSGGCGGGVVFGLETIVYC